MLASPGMVAQTRPVRSSAKSLPAPQGILIQLSKIMTFFRQQHPSDWLDNFAGYSVWAPILPNRASELRALILTYATIT